MQYERMTTLSINDKTSAAASIASRELQQSSTVSSAEKETEAYTSASKTETSAASSASGSNEFKVYSSVSAESSLSSAKETEAYTEASVVSSEVLSETVVALSGSTESVLRSGAPETVSETYAAEASVYSAKSYSSTDEFLKSSIVIDQYQYTVLNRLDVIAVLMLICAGLLFFLVIRSINSTKK